MKRLPALALILVGAVSHAQEPDPRQVGVSRSGWYAGSGPSLGQDIIGSEEIRRGTILFVGYRRPEKRFELWGRPGELRMEGYYMYTRGAGFFGLITDQMHSFGALASARWRFKWRTEIVPYLELGWGLVYNNQKTFDLNSRLNSTPVAAVGVEFPFFGSEAGFGVRFYHVSNAGTVGSNQGSNNFQFLFSINF